MHINGNRGRSFLSTTFHRGLIYLQNLPVLIYANEILRLILKKQHESGVIYFHEFLFLGKVSLRVLTSISLQPEAYEGISFPVEQLNEFS